MFLECIIGSRVLVAKFVKCRSLACYDERQKVGSEVFYPKRTWKRVGNYYPRDDGLHKMRGRDPVLAGDAAVDRLVFDDVQRRKVGRSLFRQRVVLKLHQEIAIVLLFALLVDRRPLV